MKVVHMFKKKPVFAYGLATVVLILMVTLSLSSKINIRIPESKTVLDRFEISDNSTASYNHHYVSVLKNNKNIMKLPVGERCKEYFDLLYITEPSWTLHPQNDDFYHSNVQQTIEYIHHFNIYNHCFLKKASVLETTPGEEAYRELVIHKNRGDIEHRIFPWLTRKLPIFVNQYTGVTIGPPLIDADKPKDHSVRLDYDVEKYKQDWFNNELPLDVPFFSAINKNSKGKGIIITLSDDFIELAIKLIRNLRILGTSLPIQIIHYNEISVETMNKLIEEATSDFDAYDKDLFQSLKASADYPYFNESFPKLDITFIDTAPSIGSVDTFQRFNRKFLALMFNTFEEFMLLDADAVLFVKPELFFESSQYQQTKSLFFKDRDVPLARPKEFREYLKLSRPNQYDSKLFNIPIVDDSIFEKEYFVHRSYNYMESGIVCMDKAKFFPGLLMTYLLSTKRLATESGHGDKEFFWMGQLIAGETDFAFNENWAAFVGEISAGRDGLLSNEICSTHPSHISSDNDKLLWINSGALQCKKTDFNIENDLEDMGKKYPQYISNVEDLKAYYSGPINIDYILFTAASLVDGEGPEDLKGEPSSGSMQTNNCHNYLWCGYDQVGFGETESQKGRLIKVPDHDRTFYSYIVKSYMLR